MGRGRSNGLYEFQTRVDLSGISKAYRLIGRGMPDFRPVYIQFIGELMQDTRKAASGGRGPDGETWGKYSADYLRRKGGRANLVFSGKLMREMGGSPSIKKVTRRGMEYGTNLPYARAVQWGRAAGSGKKRSVNRIPSRVFFGISDKMKNRLIELMDEHQAQAIDKIAKKAGM